MAARDLERGGDIAAGGDSAEDTFLAGQAAGHLYRFVRGGGHHTVDILQVQHLGDEAVADALDLMRSPASAGDDITLGRFDDEDLDGGILLFEVFRRAGDCSPGALREHQRADATLRLLPDLRASSEERR